MGNSQPFLPGPEKWVSWLEGQRGRMCAGGGRRGGSARWAHSPLPAWLLATVPGAGFAQGSSGSRWPDILTLSPSTCSVLQAGKRCSIFLVASAVRILEGSPGICVLCAGCTSMGFKRGNPSYTRVSQMCLLMHRYSDPFVK